MVRTFPNKEDRINSLEYTLIKTTTRWWGTHRSNLISWDKVMYHISLCFITPYLIIIVIDKYLDDTDPITYIIVYESIWKYLTNLYPNTWVHIFQWMLGTIPCAWYI